MRLARVTIAEEIGSDYVRTAAAKGLPRRKVLRQATRPSYAPVASLIGAWVPTFVTNMVLVEFVFFIPGFLGLSRRAFGQAPRTLVPNEPIGHIDIVDGASARAVDGGADRARQRAGRRRARRARPAGAREPDDLSARRRDGDPRRALATAQRHLAVERPARGLRAAGAVDGVAAGQQPLIVLLGELGEARRLVDRVADHRVLEARLGADVAGHDRAAGDADGGVQPAVELRRGGRAACARTASARRAWSSCGTGAPNTHSAASPSNLLTMPPRSWTSATTTWKNALSSATTRSGLSRWASCGGADDVDEQRRDLARLAAELDAAARAPRARRRSRPGGRRGRAAARARAGRRPCR